MKAFVRVSSCPPLGSTRLWEPRFLKPKAQGTCQACVLRDTGPSLCPHPADASTCPVAMGGGPRGPLTHRHAVWEALMRSQTIRRGETLLRTSYARVPETESQKQPLLLSCGKEAPSAQRPPRSPPGKLRALPTQIKCPSYGLILFYK